MAKRLCGVLQGGVVIPRDLIVRGIRDLDARERNAGSWPDTVVRAVDGPPQSFVELRSWLKLEGVVHDASWVLTVEKWLEGQAVRLVVELEDRVEGLEGDIESLTDY